MNRDSAIVLDVTSFISAEDFVLSQNHGAEPADPFARQCYAEVVQSLIFFDHVFVPHPTLLTPGPEDFGEHPRLLRNLFALGVVQPLTFDRTEATILQKVERGVLDALRTDGMLSLLSFVDKTARCDRAQSERGSTNRMLARITDWTAFQADRVHPYQGARIGTPDGVDADQLGDWARASATAIEGQLRKVLPDPDAQVRLTATLVRSLKYTARADVKKLTYQPHPLRRDFCLTFDMTAGGASDGDVFDVIREIRGIHRTLRDAAGAAHDSRLQLLELELPLLGGRLWTSRERGRHNDDRWLELACGRLDEYRIRATDLRRAVSRCICEEDKLRLRVELDHVCRQLLERLGLRSTQLNETERELVRGVASVADSAIGVPVVSPLLIGGRTLGRRLNAAGNAYQKFVYREFVGAWRRSDF